MNPHWTNLATQRLLDLRDPATGGWRYTAATVPAVEPSALAALALWSVRPALTAYRQAAEGVAHWFANLQNADGSLGPSVSLSQPGWPTPFAVWVWRSLGVHEKAWEMALQWLIHHGGKTFPRNPENVSQHDTTIPGWAWQQGTHGWVEPTALSLIALKVGGLAAHPRCQEGVSLILDRVLPSGGWNCGNAVVYGRELRPQPTSTGLALMALAGLTPRSQAIEKAIGYLESILATTHAAQSLGWGLIGLAAWGQHPTAAGTWLEQASRTALVRPDAAPRLAMLLLAAYPELLIASQGTHHG